jgi:monoamine oxidase
MRLSTGESLTVDRAVLTLPVGVLQREGIEFDPPLGGARRAAIDRLGAGALETLWLRFDAPFWDTRSTRWSVVDPSGRYTEFLNLEPATGLPVIVGLIGGDAAAALQDVSDEDLVDAALTTLSAFSADRADGSTG